MEPEFSLLLLICYGDLWQAVSIFIDINESGGRAKEWINRWRQTSVFQMEISVDLEPNFHRGVIFMIDCSLVIAVFWQHELQHVVASCIHLCYPSGVMEHSWKTTNVCSTKKFLCCRPDWRPWVLPHNCKSYWWRNGKFWWVLVVVFIVGLMFLVGITILFVVM